MNILKTASGMLRDKAIESVSIIGMVSSQPSFKEVSKELMDILLSDIKENPSSLSIYNIQCFGRLFQTLREEFGIECFSLIIVPYLPQVMPTILQAMRIQPDVI